MKNCVWVLVKESFSSPGFAIRAFNFFFSFGRSYDMVWSFFSGQAEQTNNQSFFSYKLPWLTLLNQMKTEMVKNQTLINYIAEDISS